MASRFQTFSEEEIWAINEVVVHNKDQESDELWLVGVYWWVEIYFHSEFVTLNRKNALEKSPIEMIVLANKVLTYLVTYLIFKKFLFCFYPTDFGKY